VHRELLVLPQIQGLQEIRERKAHWEIQERKVPLVLLQIQELQEIRGQKVLRVLRVLKALKAILELSVQQEKLALQDLKGKQVHRGSLGLRAILVIQGQKGL
jgi:hypothetical protein